MSFDLKRLESSLGKSLIASDKAALFEMPADKYHADPLWEPSFSNSIAKVLLNDSPLHAWIQHPRLGNRPRKPTAAMERGTLIHDLVLGVVDPHKPEPDANIEICDFKDWRTKAAQEAKKIVLSCGKVPMTPNEYERHLASLEEQWLETQDAVAVANSVIGQLEDHGLAPDGMIEHVGVWEEDTLAGPVLCRCRIDCLWPERAAIMDLKTTWKAKPEMLPKHVLDYGYDVQQAAYTSFLRKLMPNMAGREEFTFTFIEELPAAHRGTTRSITIPVKLNGEFRAIGDAKWARACRKWRECLSTGIWESYSMNTTVHLEPPAWAMAGELQQESA